MAGAGQAARHDTKLARVLYHDWEAESYDDKWSISHDKRCVDYARPFLTPSSPKEAKRPTLPNTGVLGIGLQRNRVLLLNLVVRGGAPWVGDGPLAGMVKVATRGATAVAGPRRRPGRRCRAFRMTTTPFDLAVGRAVLHHIPDKSKLSLRGASRSCRAADSCSRVFLHHRRQMPTPGAGGSDRRPR